MQQILVQGSFEGCLVQLYYYYDAASWHMERQVLTVDTIVDPTSEAQRVTYNTKKSLSLSITNAQRINIPCSHETLYYHPYQRFFFYYYKNNKIVTVGRGFTTTTGDACTVTETPTTVPFDSISISNSNYMTPPAFYKGFTFISYDSTSATRSYIQKWDVVMDASGSLTTNTLTSIMTGTDNRYIRYLYGMDDVGLFYVYDGFQGYYITKIDSTTGNEVSTASYENSKTWKIFQAPYNQEEDLRPVWLANSDAGEEGKFYKGTNVLTEHFVGTGTQYDFFKYPVVFGKYYAMQVRPGTCAQEGGSEDFDFLHVNVLSIRDKAHSICVDDSEDIFCGNGKWEEYNLEEWDDNNNANNDGCNSNCKIEDRWTCTQVVNATSSCNYVACGNEYLDATEQWDDGNLDDGDGCSSTCQIEDCYYCTAGAFKSVCTKQCENGVLNTSPGTQTYYSGSPIDEVCDEGDTSDAPGWLDCCTKIQEGYKCGAAGSECTLRCADNIVDSADPPWTTYAELCDDNNTDDGDGCRADCRFIEDEYECPAAGGACRKICGNGYLDASGAANTNVNGGYNQGSYTAEQCDYSVAGSNNVANFQDDFSVCCDDSCQTDTSRSIIKKIELDFSYDEETFISYDADVTFVNRQLSTTKDYCVPLCKSLYTKGPEFRSTWVTAYNAQFPIRLNADDPSTATSGTLDLTEYIETVSNYYIDPTTRVCYTGKYCYNWLVPKFPGYASSAQTDTDSTVIRQSRGKIRIIEKDVSVYGFSIVTNGKSELQFTNNAWDMTIDIPTSGTNRQSFGKWYVQTKSDDPGIQQIYSLDTTFAMTYQTTESIVSFAGWDRALWWPTKDFLLFRQFDKITWDGFGLNSDSIDVAANPGNYDKTPEKLFEPFSTGPIKIDGDLPFDAVFTEDNLALYRKDTMDSKNYVSIYSWTPGHFKIESTVEDTSTKEATSLVSFGTDGVLLWHKEEVTGTLYKSDGSTTSITIEVTDGTLAGTLSGLAAADTDIRLLQARPSPENPEQNSKVYGFFTQGDLFEVTLDVANTKIVLDPVVALDSRFNLYQPVDIGHYRLANMVVLPCTVPATDTDIYGEASVLYYKLGGASTEFECIELTSSEITFK